MPARSPASPTAATLSTSSPVATLMSSVHALVEAAASATVFSAGSDFLVRAWTLNLLPLRTLRAHTSAVHCLAAPAAPAADAPEVWSGGEDRCLHVWAASEASGFAHHASVDELHAAVRVLAAQPGPTPRVWAADADGTLRSRRRFRRGWQGVGGRRIPGRHYGPLERLRSGCGRGVGGWQRRLVDRGEPHLRAHRRRRGRRARPRGWRGRRTTSCMIHRE